MAGFSGVAFSSAKKHELWEKKEYVRKMLAQYYQAKYPYVKCSKILATLSYSKIRG